MNTSAPSPALQRLMHWYTTLQPGSLDQIAAFYTDDARFRDPFNDVHSRERIADIFRHMFATLEAPRFIITGHVGDAPACVILWQMHFRFRQTPYVIEGCSHLLFTADGRVHVHRDYWDAADELYEKLPLLGWLMRRLRHRLATPAPAGARP